MRGKTNLQILLAEEDSGVSFLHIAGKSQKKDLKNFRELIMRGPEPGKVILW